MFMVDADVGCADDVDSDVAGNVVANVADDVDKSVVCFC